MVVKELLHHPSVAIDSSDVCGNTAIHAASVTGNVIGLRMLLGDPRLTCVDTRNEDGQTPLMTAVRSSVIDSVRELVERADLETRDGEGRSLEEVARYGVVTDCEVMTYS